MAEEKKISMPEDAGVGATQPEAENSIDEKLKAAAGNINRHNADSKQRESELVRESREKAKEERQRTKEAEKRNSDVHREAMLNAAAEREAFEEQRRQRKKLERERRRKMEEERRVAAEERRAREEARAREVAEALERERAEIEASKAKSAALINRFGTQEEPSAEQVVETPKAEVVESVEAPAIEEPAVEAEPAANVPAAEEEPAVEEPVVEAPVAEEPVAEEEPVVETAPEVGEDAEEKAELDVSVKDEGGKFILTLGEDEKDAPKGDFIIEIGKDEPKAEEKPTVPAAPEPAKAAAPETAKKAEVKVEEKPAAPKKSGKPDERIKLTAPNLASTDMLEIEEVEIEDDCEEITRIPITIYDDDGEAVVVERPALDEDVPPLEFEDDLIASIKKQGKAVHDKKSYKKYIKRSEKAINAFYNDIARIDKSIDNLDDENQIPPMIVNSVVIMGKIVDIRADNLAVTVASQKKKVTDKVRDALARDIENYNSRVAYFAKVTGGKLTRLSSFLPDAIANGTGKPVIPELKYTENYVEIFPDADGNLPKEDDNVSTIVIAPIVSFEDEIGNTEPKTRDEAKDFIKRVNKSKKKLLSKISNTAKLIEKNAKAKRRNLEKEEGAFTAREQDVAECLASYSRKDRRGKKYAKVREAIDQRYRKVILEAREERNDRRYDDIDKCLYVERLTAERERVVFTLEAIRSLKGIVTPKELKAIAASAIREMQTYNSLAKECGERIGKELSVVSGALADEVMRSGESYVFPMIVKRRELCERVGKNERLVGDRVLDDYLKTTKAERLRRIRERFNFEGDKSLSDRALMREDIRLRAIERLAAQVKDKKSFKRLTKKCKYSFKEFKHTLKQTDKAIFRARDKDGVIAAMTENLRVRGKLIASVAVALECATDNRRKKFIKKYSSLLENQIERYNQRCADYRIITVSQEKENGYKLTQISSFLPENITEGLTSAVVPELSYRERYIECYPNTKDADNAYVDPAKRGSEYYPIDYNDRRYTENEMVEITVINPPISASDTMRSDIRAEGRLDCVSANSECFFTLYGARGLNYYLKRAKRHKKKALRQSKKFDKKLNKLIKRYEKKSRKLNDKTPELMRDNPKYVRRLERLEAKYTQKSIKLRYKRVKKGIERRVLNYSVRELAIFREFVAAYSLRLKRVRTSAIKKHIDGAKDALISAIRKHNDMADALSAVLGKPIVRISTTIAEEIIRYGNVYRLPKIALCRETIERVGEGGRTIGDPYRHGMPYTVNSQGIAVVTGTCRIAPGVGIKGIGIDSDLKPIIGATHSGLAYAGTPNPSVLGLAVNGNVATSPALAGKNNPLFGIAGELAEAEDSMFSDIDMKPVSAEIKEINNFLVGAISARADAVSSVFDYRHYTRRSRYVAKRVRKVFKVNNRTYEKYRKLCDNFAIRRGTARIFEELVKNGELTKAALHSRYSKKALGKIRAKVFESIEKKRSYEQYLVAFELRTLASLGKYIEIKCADLRAASKLQLTVSRQFKLWLLNLGFNPRKKCKKALSAEIERYNDIHVDRAEQIIGKKSKYDLTLIDTMLPAALANREKVEIIPELVYRDRYAEVVTTKVAESVLDEKAIAKKARTDEVNYVALNKVCENEDGSKVKSTLLLGGIYVKETAKSDVDAKDAKASEPEVNLVNSEAIPVIPVLRKARYFKREEKFNKALKPAFENDAKVKITRGFINKMLKKLDGTLDSLDKLVESKIRDAQGYGDKQEKFVKKKLFALHRYEKAVFRISRITNESAKYQRKMSRRLWWFRRRLYKLRMKEISFGIVGGRVKVGSGYEARVPNMNFAELRKKSLVEALILERRRLMLAVRLCEAAHVNEYKGRMAALSKARRAVTAAMLHYNAVADECERMLKTKKLWRPDMNWYKNVQQGEFNKAVADAPKLVALRQLAESYDGRIKPITD